LEKYEIVRAMFRPDTKGGFDYRPALDPAATSQARLAIMAGAIDWVLTLQQADAAKETTDEAKKRAHRRYADAAVALSKAFALAAASDEARSIREEVGFFQAIRAALIKSVPGDGKKSTAERELAIQQIVSRAVVSTEIVDIMKAAGLESPDISILSDEFLAEVRDTDKKNLAIEALKKLINGDVRSQSKRNVTQSKAFTERLEAAIARYHANALTTAQVLEELIALAKDIRAGRNYPRAPPDQRSDRSTTQACGACSITSPRLKSPFVYWRRRNRQLSRASLLALPLVRRNGDGASPQSSRIRSSTRARLLRRRTYRRCQNRGVTHLPGLAWGMS
jgi:hypothetical protein